MFLKAFFLNNNTEIYIKFIIQKMNICLSFKITTNIFVI